MKKGELTREMILEKAAGLFNSRGYFGASMSDVMEATGLEKGGIYNHFGSKDELALAAFDFVIEIHGSRIKKAVDQHELAIDKLIAFVDAFEDVILNPAVPGGCPLLNSAVESDDAHPALREKVRKAVQKLLRFVEKLAKTGVKRGELKPTVAPYAVATYIVASLEGAVMLTKLYDDPARFSIVATTVKEFIKSCAQAQ